MIIAYGMKEVLPKEVEIRFNQLLTLTAITSCSICGKATEEAQNFATTYTLLRH